MSKPIIASGPVLVTVPNVPICATGIEYALSSGPATFTAEDLLDAVASQDDPAIKPPRFGIGHIDPRYNGPEYDGTPAFGKFVNLRVEENGQVLVADIAGVPGWLADIMPVAFPNRSIEGNMEVETVTGHKWRLCIWAVKALGVLWPGVSTLEDLPLYYGDEMPEDVVIVNNEEDDVGAKVAAARSRPAAVTAAVNVDDVRREYYDQLDGPGQTWWWIRSMYLDPNELIVDDDDGGLYRVGFTVDGDSVEFAEPQKVKVQYVNAAGKDGAKAPVALVASSGREVVSYTDRVAAGRPDDKEHDVKINVSDLRARLGLSEEQLPDSATEEQINAAIAGDQPNAAAEVEQESPVAAAPGSGDEKPAVPEGMMLVDKETFDLVKSQAEEGAAVAASVKLKDRDSTIAAATKEGRIPPSRKEHYAAMWDKDPEGTRTLLTASEDKGGLAKGLVPVTERGSAEPTDGSIAAGSEYDMSLLSAGERQRIEAARAGTLETPSVHVEKGA